ncbi:MAG: hypothetical protein LBL64_08630, partial [Treponema sp.]|nr:hypothetical protein [Treponema sp.]
IPKVENRINQYLQFLKGLRYRELFPLDFEYFETEESFRRPPEDKAKWKKIAAGGDYGKPWHCAWFRTSFKSPLPAKGAYPLYLRVFPNADSLVFIDGKPAGAFNPFHKKVKAERDGKTHTLCLEAYEGHYYPGEHSHSGRRVMLTLGRQIPDYPNTFGGGSLVERVEPVYGLYYDVRCLFELARTLDADSLRRARILKGLYETLMEIPFSAGGSVSTGMNGSPDWPLLEKLAAEVAKKLKALLAAKNGPTVPVIDLTGHAHIDHAWLWTISETERKAARTFMNMVALSREYPEFVFIQTQPVQLETVKAQYPDIFEAVKEAYRKGNWEPNGGMWVEADCNLTGGEALVRQFLVGKKTTKALLDYESDTLWLPDVFGYAAALPQILQGCGIEYFVTSKINWNDTTRFPYDTFIWRGIDGTAVKTHYIISFKEGYNGRVSPESLKEIWHEVQHKEIQSAAVKSIGEGDGGGGTLRSDLEMARRLSNLEGAPRTEWKKVSAALKEIFKNAAELPEWRGELYLELHRGTYTTQAKTKRWNRKNEYALREAEWISALASLEKGVPYPHGKLLESWKSLLTLQFHDIIPGSSINKVYVEAEAAHEKNAALLESLAGEKRGLFCGNAAAKKGNITVFNSLSWQRGDPVTVHGTISANVKALVSQCPRPEGHDTEETTALHGNNRFPVQHYRDLDGKETAVFVPQLPPSGWISFSVSEDIPAVKDPAGKASVFLYKPGTLQTPFYKVRFDKSGRITSLADANTGKEYVAPGGFFNRLISADDVPVFWEAWDIDSDWKRYINEETRLIHSEVTANGPVVFRLRQKWQIGSKSTLLQDTVFYTESRRIDFETKVDWHERRKLLKAAFDTGIDAPQVRCEVQYGHLLRNTHRNLPHDRAKFEICAHKWISLEDAGAGIALLNDCKYGHDVSAEEAGVSMRITLLRSPTAPDEEADQGEQRFTYSLLPFALPFAHSRVIRSAYELNIPAAVERGGDSGAASSAYSLFSISGDSVIAECIKAPELSSGEGGGKPDLVLRLYESLGTAEKTVLRFRRELAGAWTADMLERRPVKLPFKGNELSLGFRGFEIKTVLLAFK